MRMAEKLSGPRWELYLASAPSDAQPAEALYSALRAGARVFRQGKDVDLGEDRERASALALSEAPIGVFVLSRATAAASEVRSNLLDAIDRFRRDSLRRVIPVHLDSEAQSDPLYGVRNLQAVSAISGDMQAAAGEILKTVALYRAQRKMRPRVAIVAVAAELGAEQQAVAQRLGSSTANATVSVVDAAKPDALEEARRADYRLLLVGMRTGGSEALAQLVEQGADCLKVKTVDLDLAVPSEVAAVQAVRRKAGRSFVSPDEAAHCAQELFADWLKAWVTLGEGRGAALEEWEAAYLQASLLKWEEGSYGGLKARAGGRQLNRARLYVSLRAAAEPTCYADEKEGLKVGKAEAEKPRGRSKKRRRKYEMPAMEEERQKQRDPFLERVLSYSGFPFLAIEGEAGSGKTVLLQHTAYALACRHLNRPLPASELDEAGLSEGAPLLRIPIFIEARRLADLLPRGVQGELSEALAAEVRLIADRPAVTADALREGMRAGRYLLLIDSLDEVPSIQARARVLECVAVFSQRDDCACRLVLTSRPMAHTGLALEKGRLRPVRVAPLDASRVDQMVERWVSAAGESAEYRDLLRQAIRELIERHPPGEGGRSIPENPQLLTCAFLVFDQQRLLPDSPAALFERMVQILCDAKPSKDLPAEAKRQLLERVFESIQRAGGTERDAREVAEDLLGAQVDLEDVDGALSLLERLANETGLLCFERRKDERGAELRIARPWHRSFEEYLCASRLASGADSVANETDKLVGTREEPGVLFSESWEGVMTFLYGVHGARGCDRSGAFVERLLERSASVDPRSRGRILGVAARGLAEDPLVKVDTSLRDRLRHEIANRFAEEGASWPQRDRLLALEAVGRLGDPRLDADPWVEIAGGSFAMGGDEEALRSVPRQIVSVAPFRMMWRPITVQDYGAFVDAGGYASEAWWVAGRFEEKKEREQPEKWSSQRLYHPNRPVTGVTWFEAMAFCRWASKEWNLEIDLPTDAQWELAARGPEASTYPWGEDEPGEGDDARANHCLLKGAVLHPSPVGAFPRGNRRRLVDMAGNVWEWCGDIWSDGGPRTPAPQSLRDAPRVVRGGSWRGDPRLLRCACRFRFHPESRHPSLGFRVVCRGSRQH
jgi:formylglycine-generating enzyme required for sulfatase activity